MAEKVFCYVDESGQDTQGILFIVAIVITSHERDQLYEICSQMEIESKKLERKWHKTNHTRRVTFVQQVMQSRLFDGKLYFAVYRNEADYLAATVRAIISVLTMTHAIESEVTVLIDGLPKALEQDIGLFLRRRNIAAKKVRGVNDQRDSLIRLADAICGWVRCALDGEKDFEQLLKEAIKRGILREATSS